jgi:hypothetical protein
MFRLHYMNQNLRQRLFLRSSFYNISKTFSPIRYNYFQVPGPKSSYSPIMCNGILNNLMILFPIYWNFKSEAKNFVDTTY